MSVLSRRQLLSSTPALALAAASTSLAAPAIAKDVDQNAVMTSAADIIATEHGAIRGFSIGRTHVFKGIPYAQTGGQAGRFTAARPPTPWKGVRETLSYGPICPQIAPGAGISPNAAFLLPRNFTVQDEECLSLNLWSPGLDLQARHPVMVWIHGGEFSAGASNELAVYDGLHLARDGNVVVVSVNHRLNVLGFLNLEGLGAGEFWNGKANLGMLDIVSALEWVRRHIGQFGGDAGNVTLFGQSGGGLKITTLMAMPAAKGLFHKAIVQSGSETKIFRPHITQGFGTALLDLLQLTPKTADRLRSMPIATLIAASEKATAQSAQFPVIGHRIWSFVGWAPTLDGHVIPHDPYVADNHDFQNVPLLVGSARHEFSPAVFLPAMAGITDAEIVEKLAQVEGTRAAEIVGIFRRRSPSATPALLYAEISTQAFNGRNAAEQARLKAAQNGAPAYLYRFSWQTKLLDGTPGAFHGSELPFVFRNIDLCPVGDLAPATRLMDDVSRSWIAFARTGDPNHKSLARWAPVTADSLQTMIFDTTSHVENDPDRSLRDAVGQI
jgi:para-nitrobenzyl esterase